jgi:mRNA interferase YafQ
LNQPPAFAATSNARKKGPHGNRLDAVLAQAIDLLAADTPLPPRFRDHPLSGAWNDCRDCHIRPDLVLIYRKPDEDTLQLVHFLYLLLATWWRDGIAFAQARSCKLKVDGRRR